MHQYLFFENEIIRLQFLDGSEYQTEGINPKFLLVLEGRCRIDTAADVGSAGTGGRILAENDFLLLNAEEEFSLRPAGGAVFLALLEMKYYRVDRFWHLAGHRLSCSSFAKDAVAERVRQLLQRILNLAESGQAEDQPLLLAVCYQLVYVLQTHCLQEKAEESSAKTEDLLRQQKIADYIHENYNQPVTLQLLSEETYFTTAYLSRYIKKKFGKSLTELLVEIRLQHAVDDLVHTDDTLTQIAMNHGFASVSAFNKAFRAVYKQAPGEYRSKSRGEAEREERGQEAGMIRRRVNNYFSRIGFQMTEEGIQLLAADTANARYLKRFWNQMVNVGPAADLLQADIQEQILFLKEELGITYIRFWDIYAPEMMLYDGDPQRQYSFSKLDMVMDFLYTHQLRPYMEFGFKPVQIVRTAGNMITQNPREVIFSNAEEFGDFVEAFLRHYAGRYGLAEVSQWYLEEWLDPRFSDFDEYLQYFEQLYRRAKRFSTDLKIGGSGFGSENTVNLDHMLALWQKRFCHPDFFSFYAYPYQNMKIVYLYETESSDVSCLSRDPQYIKKYVQMILQKLHTHGFWQQEVHLSEWNFSVANRNGLHDSIFKGAYIVKNLIDLRDAPDLVGYWYASDLYAGYYDSGKLLDGSAGLLSRSGIRKPAFHAFSFFNRLKEYLIGVDENAAVTTNLHDEYAVVCHNYCPPNVRYYEKLEKISVEEADLCYLKDEKRLRVRISNVRNGTYQIKERMVDDQFGSVLDEWRRMDFLKDLQPQDLRYLRNICVPRMRSYNIMVKDGVLEIGVILAANAIAQIDAVYQV